MIEFRFPLLRAFHVFFVFCHPVALLPNGLDFRHLAFFCLPYHFHSISAYIHNMHEVKLRLVKKENAHYPNGCKQTKVDRKMIEYIIPTNRIKHSNHLKRTMTRDMLSSVQFRNEMLICWVTSNLGRFLQIDFRSMSFVCLKRPFQIRIDKMELGYSKLPPLCYLCPSTDWASYLY